MNTTETTNDAPKSVDIPLSEMPDDIAADTSAVQPRSDDDIDAHGMSKEEVLQEQQGEQEEHDARVEDAFPPESEKPDSVPGIEKDGAPMDLDFWSLTSFKWMKRAGSLVVKQQIPEGLDEICREVAIYILAHDKSKTLRKRAEIFALPKADLEIEIDLVGADVHLAKVQPVFAAIADKLVQETSTLAIPVDDGDDAAEAIDAGNS